MMPASIINGFKGTGIYPYNPRWYILRKVPGGPASNSTTTSPSSEPATASHSSTSTTPGLPSYSALYHHYSVKEEELFQTRYEEGYDLFDLKYMYVSWLEINHPEVVPADHYFLTPAMDAVGSPSVAEMFSHVIPCEPVQTNESSSLNDCSPILLSTSDRPPTSNGGSPSVASNGRSSVTSNNRPPTSNDDSPPVTSSDLPSTSNGSPSSGHLPTSSTIICSPTSDTVSSPSSD